MSSRSRRDERGGSTIELVIATPLLLLLVMLIIQFGVWQHASSIARTAAQDGLRMTRTDGGTPQDGQDRAYSLLAQLGSSVVVNPVVTVERTDLDAAVRVEAQSQSIIPGITLPVRAFATGPVESFRAQQ
jgi:Flp pilus assembly protein TadG